MTGKLRILIVDDDKYLIKTMADILEYAGYEVVSSLNGEEAIKLAQKNNFDCIFLDILMPQMNGIETLRGLRKVSPQSLIVMMTAYALYDLLEEAEKEGALTVMAKPVDLRKLIEMLSNIRKSNSIIIVDDDRSFCKTLGDSLEAIGYNITYAHNGYDAILAVEKNSIDFVLLDMKLPDQDGLEVMAAILKINPRIAFILMSGYCSMENLMHKGLKRAAFASLRKPFEMNSVIDILEDMKRKKLADIL